MDEQTKAEFERWYQTVYPRLVSTLSATTGDRASAIDTADEAVARAFLAWPKLTNHPSLDGWLFRTAFNLVKRKQLRAKLEEQILRRRLPGQDVPGPAGEIWLAVADLPTRQRQAVALRHLANMTEPEIADVMNCTRGTVSSHLRAGHKHLREQLEPTRTRVANANVD